MNKLVTKPFLTVCTLVALWFFYSFAHAAPYLQLKKDEPDRITREIAQYVDEYSSLIDLSVEIAEEKIEYGKQLELKVQRFFEAGERQCSEQFFVNNCLESLRQQRRSWQDQIRSVILSAKTFVRQAKVSTKKRNVDSPLKN